MDVFAFRNGLVSEYERFSRSFTRIRADDIRQRVDEWYAAQTFWPPPLIQLNPNFVAGRTIDELVDAGVLEAECRNIFRRDKAPGHVGATLHLHRHQEEAIAAAQRGESYVLTTGTGSGKSLAYFIPIVNDVLARHRRGEQIKGTTAIVVYPMNALCNSQEEALKAYLRQGYGEGREPVTFARYTGQEKHEERQRIAAHPPDILLTNYVMLELLLTRQNSEDKAVVEHADGLRFLVMDELHTYRGRQGADVAMLVRRVRNRLNENLICVGTSATMASEGGAEDRAQVVAAFATRLFGSPVRPENVITETLTRVTPEEVSLDRAALSAALRGGVPERAEYDELCRHPLAAWIETRLGLEWEESVAGGKWVRLPRPLTVRNAAERLAEESGQPVDACETYLGRFLLLAYHTRSPQGHSLFAFRLHQFISGAGDLYGTLEPAGARYLTLQGQQFQPGTRTEPGTPGKRLFSLAFCRECGQEYYPVWARMEGKSPGRFEPRELQERSHEEDESQELLHGYYMPDPGGTFDAEDLEGGTYPEDWIEGGEGAGRIKSHFRKYRPLAVSVDAAGGIGSGTPGWFIAGNFRFCLICGVAYDTRKGEFSKLSSLSSEGRSSATTVLTLESLRYMMGEAADLKPEARKVLGFTDNRQDAALQAGHFNDFIQILLLRGALLAAIRNEPDGVLRDDVLTQRVQQHLHLDPQEYCNDPDPHGPKARNAEAALRDVLGYRLYYDLRRGWRFTNPNLEQLKLLEVRYEGLEECCVDEDAWRDAPALLAAAPPERRKVIAHELLDLMRRNLCIKTIYLDRHYGEQIRNRSFTLLREPWALVEDEQMFSAPAMVPRPQSQTRRMADFPFNMSYRSGFGRLLKRPSTWGDGDPPGFPQRFTEGDYDELVSALVGVLGNYGLVESVELERGITGYRLVGSAIEWCMGAGAAEQANAFFRALYDNVAGVLGAGGRTLHQLSAREHTAQVDSDEREKREGLFREAKLPVLFCSPTMELGVDIATLNSVYMRNVPPTPANYAQRSGRAGRAGQPALVVTYCAMRSPHDQYFFQDPTRMVAGVVNAPAIDLANEELIRSHLHAVWLAETGQALPTAIREVLDLNSPEELPIRADLVSNLESTASRDRAGRRAVAILASLQNDLSADIAPWYGDRWLDSAVSGALPNLHGAFDRWRSMYRATRRQMDRAHDLQRDPSISEQERKDARARYDEARVQHELLLQSSSNINSDFYTYRYLANQGFLPGYNFPRLPLMAFIPARRDRVARDSFLSRPRFLAISEFGPRSIIYHEGSTYRVRKAILGVRDEESVTTSAQLPVRSARLCPACGYAHFDDEKDFERCVNCGARLDGGRTLLSLYRIEQVSTRRATRITSDEEERQRLGYDVITTLRYAQSNGEPQCSSATYSENGEPLLELRYGPSATLWRINLGWRRRKNKTIYGFNIDVATGEWAKDAQAPQDEDEEGTREGKVVQRIIPFVEDRKNCLLVLPLISMEEPDLATFQYALKRGIEAAFQLETSELAAEALPDYNNRNAILLYESAEGGAGVLTRLASEPESLRTVVRRAIEVCHYKSRSGNWTNYADLEDQEPTCEAGCYRCLLSYTNQPEHSTIDRRLEAPLDLLCRLTRGEIERGQAGRTGDELFAELANLSVSSLERAWLDHVKSHGLHLPDRAQPIVEEHSTQADFGYSRIPALVYVDGPHHELVEQRRIDEQITQRLEDAGYTVIRFPKEQEAWPAIFAEYTFVFRKGM